MLIVKSNGDTVPFESEKIVRTLKRIGAKPEQIEPIVRAVERKVKEGMKTSEVYALVRKELGEQNRRLASRYHLRSGILRLGPAGFKFEKYVASILQAYKYDASVPSRDLRGMCVDHEIDVIAKSPSRTIMIEAKFRNRFNDTVNLKDAMATWARLIDLRDGSKTHETPYFDEAWIVTNGRLSESASQFGTCRGMQMISWNSDGESLSRMVDHAALYPVTVVASLQDWELEKLAANDIMLCREAVVIKPKILAEKIGVPENRADEIITECKEIVSEE